MPTHTQHHCLPKEHRRMANKMNLMWTSLEYLELYYVRKMCTMGTQYWTQKLNVNAKSTYDCVTQIYGRYMNTLHLMLTQNECIANTYNPKRGTILVTKSHWKHKMNTLLLQYALWTHYTHFYGYQKDTKWMHHKHILSEREHNIRYQIAMQTQNEYITIAKRIVNAI
jgi:hypothetical protein